MASMYSPGPIRPFRQLESTEEPLRPTLYTISKEDQERLAPYLPPKRNDFLRERPDSPPLETPVDYYHISPMEQPWEVLNAFSERLRRETDPNTLFISEIPKYKVLQFWFQYLTPEQVDTYRKDPAVASIFIDTGKAYLLGTRASVVEVGRESPIETGKAPHAQQSASQSLPHVTLTYAQSLDSQISLRPGQRTILSGVETKAMTQFLRTNHDAILVGAGTANADNPGLNTSFSYDGKTIVGLAEQPRPFILDPGKSWRPDSCEKMFRLASLGLGRAPWLIYSNATGGDEVLQKPRGPRRRIDYTPTTEDLNTKAVADRIHSVAQKIHGVGGNFIRTGNYGKSADGVEWEKILKAMWDTGIRSVMIEGGATVINDLLRTRNQHLVTSVILTIAPTYLGSGGVVVAPPRSVQDENEARLSEVTWIPFGQDVVMAGYLSPKS